MESSVTIRGHNPIKQVLIDLKGQCFILSHLDSYTLLNTALKKPLILPTLIPYRDKFVKEHNSTNFLQ